MSRGRSITDEEASRRRAEIMEAAMRCFVRKGYHRTTVEEIAREAGIAHGTLYLYFRSKKDVLFAFLEQAVKETASELLHNAEVRKPEEVLGRFIESRLQLHQGNNNLLKIIFAESLFDPTMAKEFTERVLQPTRQALSGYLQRCQEAGSLRVTDPDLAAQTLMATLAGYVLAWGAIAGQRPSAETIAFLKECFLQAYLRKGARADGSSAKNFEKE